MTTITLWNKGRRPWDLVDADGNKRHIEPDESIAMDEAKGLRLLKDYPRDWAEGERGNKRSASELSRWEQRLRDREKHLDEREKALAAREAEQNDVENDQPKEPAAGTPKKRGRPAAVASEGAE